MALTRTRALVLQTFAYGDTSKILRLLTAEHGIRSVIAKGALRAKSRFGGLLEPFTEGEAHFYIKEGRDLHTLSGFDLLRSRQSIGRDLGAFTGASLLAELVLRFGTEEPYPEMYEALTHALDRIATVPAPLASTAALTAIWEMVSLLGFQPQLDLCVSCGREIGMDEPTRFDVQAGGTACTHCRLSGRVVDAASRSEIGRMSRGELLHLPVADPSLHRSLLRVFLATHLAASQPLRSLELFVDQLV